MTLPTCRTTSTRWSLRTGTVTTFLANVGCTKFQVPKSKVTFWWMIRGSQRSFCSGNLSCSFVQDLRNRLEPYEGRYVLVLPARVVQARSCMVYRRCQVRDFSYSFAEVYRKAEQTPGVASSGEPSDDSFRNQKEICAACADQVTTVLIFSKSYCILFQVSSNCLKTGTY